MFPRQAVARRGNATISCLIPAFDGAAFSPGWSDALWDRFYTGAPPRQGQAAGANAILNYGYAVLRAATARAIVAAGLHPSLSVYHRSSGDALVLADDLMEPFRPTIDLAVRHLLHRGVSNIAGARADLVACLVADFPTPQGASPLSQVLVRLAQSLAQSFESGKLRLAFPDRPIPLASPGEGDA